VVGAGDGGTDLQGDVVNVARAMAAGAEGYPRAGGAAVPGQAGVDRVGHGRVWIAAHVDFQDRLYVDRFRIEDDLYLESRLGENAVESVLLAASGVGGGLM